MHLTRIVVSNYRRLADLDIEVRGHAVIVGANDVGKTSLLRLLHVALGAGTAQIYTALGADDLRDPALPLTVELVLQGLGPQEWTVMPHETDIGTDGSGEQLRIRLDVTVDPADPEAVTVRRWFPDSGHDRNMSREQLEAIGWRYLPATRGTGTGQLDGPNSALQALLRATDLGADKATLATLLGSVNTTLHDSTSLSDLRDKVAAHLTRAMPNKFDADDLEFLNSSSDEAVLDGVSLYLNRGGDHVAITEQSDGLRQLMQMTLFDLAQGAANIIAIDEPELHLHPSSQRTVAELFQGARNQKILVTHSPYIVSRFDPSQVITVTHDGRCQQIAASRLSQVAKAQAHWWSPRLLEALTARKVIIVEGLADRHLVEAVARNLNIGLDRLGIVVLEIDGAHKFPTVYKLLGPQGFNVPVFGLVDEKEKAIWQNAIGGKPANVFGKTLFVCDPDLEAEYCTTLTPPIVAAALIANAGAREAGILQSCAATSIADVTPQALADFCRKDKVTYAVAVADALSATRAAAITTVAALLTAAAAQ